MVIISTETETIVKRSTEEFQFVRVEGIIASFFIDSPYCRMGLPHRVVLLCSREVTLKQCGELLEQLSLCEAGQAVAAEFEVRGPNFPTL